MENGSPGWGGAKLTGKSESVCQYAMPGTPCLSTFGCNSWMWTGKEFQIRGADKRKAQDPNDRLYRGINS